MRTATVMPATVMPALGAGIHDLWAFKRCKIVDGRDRPGHDGAGSPPLAPGEKRQPLEQADILLVLEQCAVQGG